MEYTPARLRSTLNLAEALVALAAEAARFAVKELHHRPKTSRGGTLRPGTDTPLWNELAAATRRQLRRHGEKANLGRFLGLPRQRVHQYLMEKSAGPDAERTLMLLVWLSARQRGINLSGPALSRNK